MDVIITPGLIPIVDDIREGVATLGKPTDVILQGFAGLLLAALEVPGVFRADVRPLEISNEDPLEVSPGADTVMWKEFEPCPNMLPHIDGEVLNDEVVIIHPSGSQASQKSSSHIQGFVSLVYLAMLVGGRKCCGNDALWMRGPKACGPRPFCLGLRSSGR